jgi:RNA polymerase sigma factor (sigma-70 family)
MPIPPTHNELSLFKELGEGSEEALIRIYVLYYSRLAEASFRVCADRFLAKEIAFDSLQALWNNRIKVSGNDNPQGWLLKCVKNKTLNALKSERRRKTMSLADKEDIPAPANIQQNLEAKEYAKQVNGAIEKLAPKQKKIIKMVMEGFNRKEIAKDLSISESTIKKQIYNAYKNLRKILKDYPRY